MTGDGALTTTAWAEQTQQGRGKRAPRCQEVYVRPDWLVDRKVEVITDPQRLPRLAEVISVLGRFSLDVETEGLDDRHGPDGTNHKPVLYIVGLNGGTHAFLLPVRMLNEPNLPLETVNAFLRELINQAFDRKLVIEFHHAKFDTSMLSEVTGIVDWPPHAFEDSMLNAFVLRSNEPKGLKGQARAKLGFAMLELSGLMKTVRQEAVHPDLLGLGELSNDQKPRERRDYNFAALPFDQRTLDYGGGDGLATSALHAFQRPFITPDQQRLLTLEKRVMVTVQRIERALVHIDIPAVKRLLKYYARLYDLRKRQLKLIASLHGLDDFNPSSSQQTSRLLFATMGLPPTPLLESCEKLLAPLTGEAREQRLAELVSEGKAYTTRKTDLDALRQHPNQYAAEFVEGYLALGHIAKRLKTYIIPLLVNADSQGRIRASYSTTMVTGRFGQRQHTCGGATLQGIPHELAFRKVFIGRPRVTGAGLIASTIVKFDYKSQEPRLAANFSGDERLIDFFSHGDGDLHSKTAELMFGFRPAKGSDERQAAKTVGLSVMYGIGAIKLAARLTIELRRLVTVAEAKQLIDKWLKAWPQLARWLETTRREARKAHSIKTGLLGREVPTDKIVWPKDGPTLWWPNEHKGPNFKIQGTAAEMLKIALVRIDREIIARGWSHEHGGDSSVAIITTSHDEIVIDARPDRVVDVVPLAATIMESAVNPAWPVPMPVDVTVGPCWGGGYAAVPAEPRHHGSPDWLVRNGYAYALTRAVETAHGAPEEILAPCETREGPYVIRVSNPPWLV